MRSGKPKKAISSEDLASLIVDALADAGLVPRDKFAEAVKIAAQEIEVRKEMGDYSA
jgi:hypothetical protein